ncbi:hypothetical protein R3P38DRAFT_3282676 [Favolaschia claudopus]|uniref:F-box domain-containing protein n=1 Tax=Favolaschia claudopus TaxID=2862362 RepID=A0AAW0ABY0_9AGAR
MHRCLEINEILVYIFNLALAPPDDYLAALELDADEYGDLLDSHDQDTNPLSLALTCRAFLEPAMGLIWYSISSFNMLKGCIPLDGEPIDSPAWDSFKSYAWRVKEYGTWPRIPYLKTLYRNKFLGNDPRLLAVLKAAYPRGSKMLPNLVYLDIIEPCMMEMIPSLHGNGLKTLSLTLRPQEFPLSPSWDVPELPASIERYKISHSLCPPEETAVLINMSRQLPALKYVELANNIHSGPTGEEVNCTEDVFAHLSSLSTLRSVSVSCDSLAPSDAGIDVESRGFSSLESLDLAVPDSNEFMRRLARISSHKLTSVGITLRDAAPTSTQVQTALSAIRAKLEMAVPAKLSIKNVGHHQWHRDAELEGIIIILFQPETILHPLLDLHNLADLTICLHSPLDVDHSLLKTMMAAWPALRALQLISCCCGDGPARITLPGLRPLAEHKELRSCSLIIDATTYMQHPPMRSSSLLRSFIVNGSPVASPHLVAAFLSELLTSRVVGCQERLR